MTKRTARTSILLIGLAAALSACSEDRQVIHSTVFVPKTYTIRQLGVDQATGIIWTKDIPVQHKLNVRLTNKGDAPPFTIKKYSATLLTWKLINVRTKVVVGKGIVPLPGVAMLQEITIRESPEYPPGFLQPVYGFVDNAESTTGSAAPATESPPGDESTEEAPTDNAQSNAR